MTTLQKLSKIIIKANPMIGAKCKDGYVLFRDINLEDILRAIEHKSNSEKGLSFPEEDIVEYPALFIIGKVIKMWLLSKPLQDQTEECIDSLIKLLKE